MSLASFSVLFKKDTIKDVSLPFTFFISFHFWKNVEDGEDHSILQHIFTSLFFHSCFDFYSIKKWILHSQTFFFSLDLEKKKKMRKISSSSPLSFQLNMDKRETTWNTIITLIENITEHFGKSWKFFLWKSWGLSTKMSRYWNIWTFLKN